MGADMPAAAIMSRIPRQYSRAAQPQRGSESLNVTYSCANIAAQRGAWLERGPDWEGACCAVAAGAPVPRPARPRTERWYLRHRRGGAAAGAQRGRGRYRLRELKRASYFALKVPHDFGAAAFFFAGAQHVPGGKRCAGRSRAGPYWTRIDELPASHDPTQRRHGQGHDGAVRPAPDRAPPRAEGKEVFQGWIRCISMAGISCF